MTSRSASFPVTSRHLKAVLPVRKLVRERIMTIIKFVNERDEHHGLLVLNKVVFVVCCLEFCQLSTATTPSAYVVHLQLPA